MTNKTTALVSIVLALVLVFALAVTSTAGTTSGYYWDAEGHSKGEDKTDAVWYGGSASVLGEEYLRQMKPFLAYGETYFGAMDIYWETLHVNESSGRAEIGFNFGAAHAGETARLRHFRNIDSGTLTNDATYTAVVDADGWAWFQAPDNALDSPFMASIKVAKTGATVVKESNVPSDNFTVGTRIVEEAAPVEANPNTGLALWF